MAVTFVAVGDPVAGMVRDKWRGAHIRPSHYLARDAGWRRTKVRGKSLEGSGACFVACLVAGAILAAATSIALWVVVTGAICATLMEFLSLPLNDKLTMPLASTSAMSLIKLVTVA